MGVFDKLGQAIGAKGIDIEDYMGSEEMEDVDVLHEPADMYVKPVAVTGDADVKLIEDELSRRNIILLNIEELNKRPNTRTSVIATLKEFVSKINGDIAQIDESRILLTPSKIKIIKRKKSASASGSRR